MRVLLLSYGAVDAARVTADIAECGLNASHLALSDGASLQVPAGIDRAVLILRGPAVIEISDFVQQAREALDSHVPLLVCCQQLTATDRRAVTRCGATSIVAPKDWDPGSISERILGELIAGNDVKPNRCGDLWGGAAAMQQLYRQIETVAPLAETVLILGETGTGKERVAQEIHARSRRSGDLVAVNSAEFTPELLGSELFGHERGAFSGAERKREGLLVTAGEGTFFLDEIGDLAPSAQAKLLRVLEERKVRPVGSNKWEPVHARIVLATRRNLESATDDQFRRDLFERLRGFVLRLPPLRERRADLPLLVQCFVHEYNRDYPGSRKVPTQVLDSLFRHTWPGNVRELRLAVREAAAYAGSSDGMVSAVHLLEAAQRRAPNGENGDNVSFDPSSETWRQVLDRLRAKYFRAVLHQTGGNKDAAAHRAGLSRSQFYEILKSLEDETI